MCWDREHILFTSKKSDKKNEYYIFEDPAIAPLQAANVEPKQDGVFSLFQKITLSVSGFVKQYHKPVIAPADLIIPPTLHYASIVPSRSDEGSVRNDIDTAYMGQYGLRLMKVYNKNAELSISDVSFENSGISEDVDYNSFLTEHVDNSAIATTTRSTTLTRVSRSKCNGGRYYWKY